jgi:TonB family protein
VTAVGPQYPEPLRGRSVPGYVRVSFTVDTLGRVVPGSEVIEQESHREFGESVCRFLRNALSTPLVVDNRRYSFRVLNVTFGFEISP